MALHPGAPISAGGYHKSNFSLKLIGVDDRRKEQWASSSKDLPGRAFLPELTASDADAAFRQEVAAFFAEHVPETYKARVGEGARLEPEDYRDWQRLLYRRGWGAPLWPREYGGPGWSASQIVIFEEEAARAHTPVQYHQGLNLIAPIIMSYGSREQCERFLPRIIAAEDWWCQGYSEPGAGSDLASLKMKAELVGDDYLVNGHKLWTSYAHVASHIFCLVRTSSSEVKQRGISLLLMEMTTPGITVRPIVTIEGKHHLNEVFFQDVRVPRRNLVGEEGLGWTYGKALLQRERALAMSNGLRLAEHLSVVKARLSDRPDCSEIRRRVAGLEIEVRGLSLLISRALAENASGGVRGPTSSVLKLLWSDVLQRVTECGLEFPVDGAAVPGAHQDNLSTISYFYNRSTSIYGGTSEIQHDVIARLLLA